MSHRSWIYLTLAIVGFALPNIFFLWYVQSNAWHLDFDAATAALFGNRLVFAFVADLLVASLVFFVWMFREARKLAISHAWIFVLLTCFFGLSFAYPFFLFIRQRRRDATRRISSDRSG
ncbi:MAG: DUF2834 domain-containing protein [Rhodothermales bacterium]|nr:DUF2834 domain-containing protein [Rhodothermales bacterium]